MLAREGHVDDADVGFEHQVVEALAHPLEAVEGDAADQVAGAAADLSDLFAVAVELGLLGEHHLAQALRAGHHALAQRFLGRIDALFDALGIGAHDV